ncbi:MAG: protoporphyrinogen oxidase [Verrucomicrobiota bacterium]
MSTPIKSIAIIGGGITGLVAAHRLVREGHRVTVFESSECLGGCIRTERDGDWLVESGPNSIQDNCPEFTRLLAELNLAERLQEANPAARNRYLVRDGKLLAAPLSPGAFLGTPLLSFGAKLRLFGDLFKRPLARPDDVSVAEFFRDHFGREAVDHAVAAMVSGIYAGDAAKLSAQHAFPTLWKMERAHGSLLRGLKASAKAKRAAGGRRGPARIVSFDDGLGVLVAALADTLPTGSVRLGARIDAITTGPVCRVGDWTGDAVILALPAAALAALQINRAGERPLAALQAVEYPSVTSLYLGYRREQVAHSLDGFGVLLPPVERRDVMGVLFSSTLFPRRAPEGHVGLTVMLGGVLRPDLAGKSDDELLSLARAELRDLLGVEGEPVFVRRRRWPAAIPQYNLGHERFLHAIKTCEQRQPGLHIGGNVRDGVALTACIAAGERLAVASIKKTT